MFKKLVILFAAQLLLFPETSRALTAMDESNQEAAIPFLSTTQSDWQKASCRTYEAPSMDEIRSFIGSVEYKSQRLKFLGLKLNGNNDERNTKVAGVDLRDENPALIQALRKMTDGQDMQAQFNINPLCDKVACAVQKIWGERLGMKLLYIHLKHGFNTSEHAYSNSLRLTEHEADQILITLKQLPEKFSPIGKNRRLTLVSKERTDIAATADALPSRIHLFGRWRAPYGIEVGTVLDEVDQFIKQYSLYHEVGHLIGFEKSRGSLVQLMPRHSSKEWKRIHSLPGCIISKYATTNEREDFAEAFSSYRFNSWNLKLICPEKYEYMKNEVYDNQEYLSTSDCR